MRFKDISIRQKLTILLMGVSATAALAACLTFYFLIVDRYQQSYLEDLNSLAEITGVNCSVSLSFGIPEDAELLLSSLGRRPSIISATIHDNDGNLFASYNTGVPLESRSDFDPASAPEMRQSVNMHVSNIIELNRKKIGVISLTDDMRSIRAFKNIATLIMSAIIAVVLGLTALFAARLTEIISRPISDLANIAHNVSTKQDYSLRAKKESADEVGNLVDAFNAMLTQIAQRNEALQKSENRFRIVINQAVDAFYLHNLEGRLVDVNQFACDSLGYSREELLTMTIADIDAKADTQQYKTEYWGRMSPESPVTIEGVHQRKDGSTFPVEIRVGFLDFGDEKLIMALARDITERLEAEKERLKLEGQLQHTQKMESIGTLAGGIAHDFNNILTPILGYIELAIVKTDDDSDIMNNLFEVQKAAERAREMVKQILTFSRHDPENLSPLKMDVVVKEALKLLRSSIPTSIEIKQNIDPNCGHVIASPTNIHQIVMNLCTNAYYAMKETGGTLGISLKPLEISPKDFNANVHLKPGPYLHFEVSDSGHGIDKTTLQRIFEPYFTTKAKGEGTGMGLSVVHGIVKSIGGHISVYSEPGQGTTFHIYLPVIESTVSLTEDLLEGPIPTGTEKIMIIDDEQTVRNIEMEMLTDLGYDVLGFASPIEALEQFTAQPTLFDLVITDMTMPKMTGDKLAKKIMAIRPDVPVVLCTGFSDLINEQSAKSMGLKGYVTKPITRHSFARTIRSALDGVEN